LFGLHIDEQNDIKDENEFNEDTQLTDDDTYKDEDELEVPMTKQVVDKCEEAIIIVWSWEEIQFKHNWYGLGYNKVHDNLFSPNYCKPIFFVSGGFLNDSQNTELEDIGKEHV